MDWVLRVVPAAQRCFAASGSLVRAVFVIVLPLAGCAVDPGGDYLGGIGDPVRGAALYAPERLGDFTRWAGNPAGAARAAAQLEFLADALRTDPRYAPQVDPTVVLQLERARAEMRAAIGIAPGAVPAAVIQRLRLAASALEVGDNRRASAALASREFSAPPGDVLAALARAPALPRTAEAASLVANEIGRLDQRR